MFVGGYRIGIDVKVDTQGCGLGGDVTDLRFASIKQRGGSGTGPACVAHAQLLNVAKKRSPMSLQKKSHTRSQ